MTQPVFPTSLHRAAAEAVYDFFSAEPQIDTVLVVNSCARGTAVAESDLDFAILAKPETSAAERSVMESAWKKHLNEHAPLKRFTQSHPFAKIHLDVISGQYEPGIWDDGGGPDYFEVEIGNQVFYSAVMGETGVYFTQLRQRWLPYYDESLRLERLEMVKQACLYDLSHISHFVKRNLHFQAFDRLYKAFQEFLQAVFIQNKTYPIAYNKWIKEQVDQWLCLPDLYTRLSPVLSVSSIESEELNAKAEMLKALVTEFLF